MSGIKNFFHDEIMAQQNDKFDEWVRDGREEMNFQEHLAGGDICQGGQCRYCEEEAEDEIEQRRRLR